MVTIVFEELDIKVDIEVKSDEERKQLYFNGKSIVYDPRNEDQLEQYNDYVNYYDYTPYESAIKASLFVEYTEELVESMISTEVIEAVAILLMDDIALPDTIVIDKDRYLNVNGKCTILPSIGTVLMDFNIVDIIKTLLPPIEKDVE